MIKFYCDVCEKEVTKENSFLDSELECPLSSNTSIIIELESEVKDIEQHFCKYCVFDAIKKLDNRARVG